jgi:hypothetical protein
MVIEIPTDLASFDRTHDGWDYEVADWSKLPAAPLVSVFMITYQHAPYIREALDSVLMQQVEFPYEICLGEDGSADGTREICLDYARRYPELIRLFLRDRANPPRSKYTAPFMHNGVETLRSCRGKYVAFLEGDDYWTDPLKLQKQVACLKQNQDSSVCFHPVKIWREGQLVDDYITKPPESSVSSILDLTQRNYMHTTSVMIRNWVDQSDLELLRLTPLGDWPLWLRVARHGRIRMLPECMAVYRVHAKGVWSVHDSESVSQAVEECLRAMIGRFSEPVDAALRAHYTGLAWRLFDSAWKKGHDHVARRHLHHLSILAPSSVGERYWQSCCTLRATTNSRTYRLSRMASRIFRVVIPTH